MRCAILQIKVDVIVIEQNINILTQEILYPSFISKKNGALHRKRFLKYPLFNPFSLFLKMSEVCNFIINQLTKYLYTRQLTSLFYFKKKDLSIAESFRNIQFLLHLPVFTLDKVCFISNKQEPRIHRKHFSKHLHFTSFSLFLTGNGVCNISNTY